jgi:hypothetical protein
MEDSRDDQSVDSLNHLLNAKVHIQKIESPNDQAVDFSKQFLNAQLNVLLQNQISNFISYPGEQDVKLGRTGSAGDDFCKQCNNMSTSHIPGGIRPTIFGGLDEFEISANDGCNICKLVLAAIRPYSSPGKLKGYIRPGASLSILFKTASKSARCELFTEIGELNP